MDSWQIILIVCFLGLAFFVVKSLRSPVGWVGALLFLVGMYQVYSGLSGIEETPDESQAETTRNALDLVKYWIILTFAGVTVCLFAPDSDD